MQFSSSTLGWPLPVALWLLPDVISTALKLNKSFNFALGPQHEEIKFTNNHFQIFQDGESTIEIEMEGESHTTVDSMVLENIEATNNEIDLQDIELLIDDDYEGSLKPTVEAAIQAKWQKIIGNDADIIVIYIFNFFYKISLKKNYCKC